MLIGRDIRYYEKVSSTNELASELLANNKAGHGTVISASYQTAGRGQRQNKWHSKALNNLTISILIKPRNIEPSKQFYISMVISIALIEALQEYAGPFSIKWPNDIYYEGDKIAGILIEHSITGSDITGSICGIGVNINETDFPDFLPNPVSLKSISGKDYNISTIMESILIQINSWYAMLEDHKFDFIKSSYLRYLYRYNEEAGFRAKNKTFRGRITGINEAGQLLVKRGDGETGAYSFKELEFC